MRATLSAVIERKSMATCGVHQDLPHLVAVGVHPRGPSGATRLIETPAGAYARAASTTRSTSSTASKGSDSRSSRPASSWFASRISLTIRPRRSDSSAMSEMKRSRPRRRGGRPSARRARPHARAPRAPRRGTAPLLTGRRPLRASRLGAGGLSRRPLRGCGSGATRGTGKSPSARHSRAGAGRPSVSPRSEVVAAC